MKNNIAKIHSLTNPKEDNVKRIVLAGLCVLAIGVSMYVYFVGKIVFDVVGRRAAEVSVENSNSDIGALAANYLDEVKGIDISQAASVGLSLSHDTLYASRETATASAGVTNEL